LLYRRPAGFVDLVLDRLFGPGGDGHDLIRSTWAISIGTSMTSRSYVFRRFPRRSSPNGLGPGGRG
jgi:hypothetical protein